MENIEGGCLCGNVRYSVMDKPLAVIQCHCKNCQKQSGSAFSINMVLAMKNVTYNKSQLTLFKDKGDSARDLYRYFCSSCGSPVFSGNATLEGVAVLKVGTLDNVGDIAPSMSIWESSAQSWLSTCEEILHFDKDVKK